MSLLPPSAFEHRTAPEHKPSLSQKQDFDRHFAQELQRKLGEAHRESPIFESPSKEPKVFESAIKNQATLIDELNGRVLNYELQIANLQQRLAQRETDLETIARECENSLETLNDGHVRTIQKVESELETCRRQLESENATRLANEERFRELDEKNRLKMTQLEVSLNEKIAELKEARDESAKLRLYFTGGRELLETTSYPLTTTRSRSPYPAECDGITNLRVQVEALQHIIDIQEQQLRTSKPNVIPGLATLEKWRRKVYEMMVRTKLNELAVAKELHENRQRVTTTNEQLKICEAKLTAKELELKEIKCRLESSQKMVSQSSGNELKFRECLQLATKGVAQLGAAFEETASKSLFELASMERRLELATKRIKQIGATQRSVAQLEEVLSERSSEKMASDMQLAVAKDAIDELRRQLAVNHHQLASVAKQKVSAIDSMESDRQAEREATAAQIRLLTSELHQLRAEHAKLISDHATVKRKLEESEVSAEESSEDLAARLQALQQDYDALATIAREHGVIDRIAARRISSPLGPRSVPGTSDMVRAQVESLYKTVIR